MSKRLDEFRTIATSRANSILVERQVYISGDNWITVDRYNTDDLSKHPKKQVPWVDEFVAKMSQEGKEFLLHKPNCGHWEGVTCDCGAAEYHNTAWGVLATPDAFNPLHETAHCRIDKVPIDEEIHYDGNMMTAMDDAATKQVINNPLTKAANG